MSLPLYQVDAFTDRLFTGNPAAVCLLDAARPAAWLQALAQEMNLSETAFLLPERAGYQLRWFTPAVEVDLCGHATLASAHVLWETGRLAPNAAAVFATRSGTLTARRKGALIELDFPATPAAEAAPPQDLLPALGIAQAAFVGRNGMDYLVVVDEEAAVRRLAPDMSRLRRVAARGIIVSAPSADPAYAFVSRFFAPQSGIDEDPVTGSAHCTLGPYWAARLERRDLQAFQASQRGGVVGVTVLDDRVLLRGSAVTVFAAQLTAA